MDVVKWECYKWIPSYMGDFGSVLKLKTVLQSNVVVIAVASIII